MSLLQTWKVENRFEKFKNLGFAIILEKFVCFFNNNANLTQFIDQNKQKFAPYLRIISVVLHCSYARNYMKKFDIFFPTMSCLFLIKPSEWFLWNDTARLRISPVEFVKDVARRRVD